MMVGDTHIHHELIETSKSKGFNKMVQETLDVIRPQGNMFDLRCSSLLRNILTQQTYPQEISDKIINCMNDGKIKFAQFRKERFIDKTKKLSDVIPKVKLPSLTDPTKDHDKPKKLHQKKRVL